ncbi:MAG: hypothetical protein WBW32_13875 [Luteibacter sp.]
MKIRKGLYLAVTLLVSSPSSAYEWRARAFGTDPQNIVMTPLIDAFRFHAEPAAVWYLEELGGNLVSREKFERFSRSVAGATYGAFEYTYTREGVRRTRIYYAMSGPDSPFTALGPPSRPMADFIAQDGTRVHAYVGVTDQTRLVSTEIEGDHAQGQHRNDAELKAARTIERDIQRGIVTRGGTLQAYVSQPMCDSCEHVLHQMGALYDIDINVDYLEADMSEAYRRFRTMVGRFMDTVLVHIRHPDGPGNPTPPPAAAMCTQIFVQ